MKKRCENCETELAMTMAAPSIIPAATLCTECGWPRSNWRHFPLPLFCKFEAQIGVSIKEASTLEDTLLSLSAWLMYRESDIARNMMENSSLLLNLFKAMFGRDPKEKE